MKLTRNKIIGIAVIVAALAVAFLWGGGAAKNNVSSEADKNPSQSVSQELNAEQEKKSDEGEEKDINAEKQEDSTKTEEAVGTKEIKASEDMDSSDSKTNDQESNSEEDKVKSAEKQKNVAYSQLQGMNIDSKTGKDQYLTNPVPEGKPIPVEPENAKISKNKKTCILSVTCNTILDNIENLDKEKVELVPEDGIILPPTTVTFYEGESVFHLLQREMKRNKIHMEFVNTPIYNSAYIEGIHNLYEFDCGELSGWMYRVNNWFPNYGCSRYQLKQDDVVEWIYTCDLGRDIGGGFREK